MSKPNKALKDDFKPAAQCKPDGIILRIFPVGRPENEADSLCFDDAKALKDYLKKHAPPDGMAYGIRDANLRDLKIKTLDFHNGYLENVDLSGAEIRLAAFSGATLKNVNFNHASLKQLNLRDGKAVDCSFASAGMPGCNLIRAKTQNCDFRYAQMGNGFLRRTVFDAALLDGADISGTDMSRVEIRDAKAMQINMETAHAEGGLFENVDFAAANMSHANLDHVRMIGCNLKDITMTGRETAQGIALAGCKHDQQFAALIQGSSLYNPRVGARALWAMRKKQKPKV